MFETTNTHETPGNRVVDIAKVVFKINCKLSGFVEHVLCYSEQFMALLYVEWADGKVLFFMWAEVAFL